MAQRFKEARELVEAPRRNARRPLEPMLGWPPDFFLFPLMKRKLKVHRFDCIDAVRAATTKALNSIPETDFKRAFDECQTRRTKCIDAGGMYFEDY